MEDKTKDDKKDEEDIHLKKLIKEMFRWAWNEVVPSKKILELFLNITQWMYFLCPIASITCTGIALGWELKIVYGISAAFATMSAIFLTIASKIAKIDEKNQKSTGGNAAQKARNAANAAADVIDFAATPQVWIAIYNFFLMILNPSQYKEYVFAIGIGITLIIVCGHRWNWHGHSYRGITIIGLLASVIIMSTAIIASNVSPLGWGSLEAWATKKSHAKIVDWFGENPDQVIYTTIKSTNCWVANKRMNPTSREKFLGKAAVMWAVQGYLPRKLDDGRLYTLVMLERDPPNKGMPDPAKKRWVPTSALKSHQL